jgi:hypothetical protein
MDGYASTLVIKEVIELLEYPEMPQDDDISIEDLLTARQRRQTATVTSASRPGGSQLGGEMADNTLNSNLQQMPTPILSEEDIIHIVPKGYRQRGEKAPQDVNLDPSDTSLIISGKRNRKQKDLNNFSIQSYAVRLGSESLINYLQAFSTEIHSISTTVDGIPRIHQSQLPPPPRAVKQLDTHLHGSQFRRAMEIEWRDLCAKGVFGRTDHLKATVDSEVLPLM